MLILPVTLDGTFCHLTLTELRRVSIAGFYALLCRACVWLRCEYRTSTAMVSSRRGGRSALVHGKLAAARRLSVLLASSRHDGTTVNFQASSKHQKFDYQPKSKKIDLCTTLSVVSLVVNFPLSDQNQHRAAKEYVA